MALKKKIQILSKFGEHRAVKQNLAVVTTVIQS